ncbi:hypothetical protein [Corynebacterium sp. LK33]|uniref:hypothetical protein n=1 Tax=Corynebacterium sp. LK33 TaxID=2044574 RepID=UPI00165299CE|nr:hypothetical protein [Corynebacterium sp. LK33]MBC6821449.1 hypothetical protein [Corynebacterium sp. LK33]
MQSSEAWIEKMAKQIGRGIDAARGKRSDQWISDRTKMLGHPISRTAISEYRRGKRKVMPVTDLFVIAGALGVPPVSLLFPGLPDEKSHLLPVQEQPVAFDALQWVTGERQTLPAGIDPVFSLETGELTGIVEGRREYRAGTETRGGTNDLYSEAAPSSQKSLIDACRELAEIFSEFRDLDTSAFLDFGDTLPPKQREAQLKVHFELVKKLQERSREVETRIQELGGVIAEETVIPIDSEDG